jgi:hypothetical protein
MNAEASLREARVQVALTLGADGWRLEPTKRGVRARWRWLVVTVEASGDAREGRAWRARLAERLPPHTLLERWADDPMAAVDPVIAEARVAQRFADGNVGLVRNPSRGWLGYRLWDAVRPAHK